MQTPRRHVAMLRRDPAPVPPLHENMADYWDARYGIGLVGTDVDTWTGRKRGIVLTAPTSSNRPPYLVDVSFRNRPAVGIRESGALSLRNDTISPDVVAASSRPYTIHAWHWVVGQAAKVGLATIMQLGNNAAGGSNQFGHYVGVTNDAFTCSYNGATAAGAGSIPAVGQGLHVTEFWADGTNLNVRDNGILAQTASAVVLNSAGITIRLGAHAGTLNAVFHAIFTSYPGDAYVARLRNWIRDQGFGP